MASESGVYGVFTLARDLYREGEVLGGIGASLGELGFVTGLGTFTTSEVITRGVTSTGFTTASGLLISAVLSPSL